MKNQMQYEEAVNTVYMARVVELTYLAMEVNRKGFFRVSIYEGAKYRNLSINIETGKYGDKTEGKFLYEKSICCDNSDASSETDWTEVKTNLQLATKEDYKPVKLYLKEDY